MERREGEGEVREGSGEKGGEGERGGDKRIGERRGWNRRWRGGMDNLMH